MPSMTPAVASSGTAFAAASGTVSRLELVPHVGLRPKVGLRPHAGSGMKVPTVATGTMVHA